MCASAETAATAWGTGILFISVPQFGLVNRHPSSEAFSTDRDEIVPPTLRVAHAAAYHLTQYGHSS